MPTYGNQHITQISRVQLPEIAQDPDLGVKYCNTPFPVVASETETDRLYNDKKGVFVKRSDVNDGITFTLEKDGVDIVPLGDYIGLPYDPLVVAFVIDWRQHLINHGAGCYRLRVNFDIAGVTGEYYEGAYELMPYGTHTVIETVRLFSYFDSFHSAKGVNFKDSGFHSSIRFGGRFGNRQPNTEINNIKHTDNIQRKIRRENINSYELQTNPLSDCFTREIIDFHLVGENEIFITDNDAMNHSYRYRDYPVILSDTPEMEHTSGRPSSVVATFEDKQLNEYTSYVSSQDPNVIEPPVCDPASVTVNGDAFGTVPAEGSIDVPIEDEDGNTLDTTVVGGVVQVFLYWYMIAVLAFRQRMIDEGATFVGNEELTECLLNSGETIYNDASLILTANGYDTGVVYAVKPNLPIGNFTYTDNAGNNPDISLNNGIYELFLDPSKSPTFKNDNISSLIGQTEGILFYQGIKNDDSTRGLIQLNDGSSTNRMFIDFNSAGDIRVSIDAGGTNIDFGAIGIPHDQLLKIAVRYKSGESALFINGVKVASSTDVLPAFSNPLETLEFMNFSGSLPYYGYIQKMMLFQVGENDAYCENLTEL